MSSPFYRTVSPRLAIFASCALVFAMQGAALAADAVSTKPLAIKTKKSPLLTREELRACMAAQTKMHEQREELTKLQGQLTAEKEDIVRTGSELKEQLAALDRTNREAIVAYTEANAARDKRIDAFELSSTAYNDKVQASETADAAYKKDCENRRFDEKDETAIKKGK